MEQTDPPTTSGFPLPPSGSDALTHCQLKTLLRLASRRARASPSQERLFSMASPLVDSLGRRLGLATEGLLEKAAAPTTPVGDLLEIKKTAKQLLARAKEHDDRQAVGLLYHVAVAAALGRHGVDISRRPITGRRRLYLRLANILPSDPLADLFLQATDPLGPSRPK